MSQVLVNIRMDKELKKSMERICHELGMNMTTAFVIFARKVSRENRIPFEVSIDPFYSASNMAAIDESARQIENGQVVVRTMEELEAMEDQQTGFFGEGLGGIPSLAGDRQEGNSQD
jgi:DNA-damage-inducible protein J